MIYDRIVIFKTFYDIFQMFTLNMWGTTWEIYPQTCVPRENSEYIKCPKISYPKVADKMAYANSADPDQTAPDGAVWSGSTLFAIP